jgi:hypothetical protein
MNAFRKIGVGDWIQIGLILFAAMGGWFSLKADVRSLQEKDAQHDSTILTIEDQIRQNTQLLYRIDGKLDEMQRRR